jgi:hypothetical protein
VVKERAYGLTFGLMPLRGEKKKLYMRSYMRRRRLEDKAFAWEKRLREERRLMKKALKRVALAERWKSEHPDEKIDPCLLSLAWHWNQVTQEAEAKIGRVGRRMKSGSIS